jgi:hypothetical protein
MMFCYFGEVRIFMSCAQAVTFHKNHTLYQIKDFKI